MADRCFTLIATVRNESGTIHAFVDSLLSQGRKPDEIPIVEAPAPTAPGKFSRITLRKHGRALD